jgi:hypothetical protein
VKHTRLRNGKELRRPKKERSSERLWRKRGAVARTVRGSWVERVLSCSIASREWFSSNGMLFNGYEYLGICRAREYSSAPPPRHYILRSTLSEARLSTNTRSKARSSLRDAGHSKAFNKSSAEPYHLSRTTAASSCQTFMLLIPMYVE